MPTIVLDCGEHCVGVLSVEEEDFRVYRVGDDIELALQRICSADEVITYNGKNYDLPLLAKFGGFGESLPLRGKHTDMRSIRWSDRIWGSKLGSTYDEYFSSRPNTSDTYEGGIESDVLMTLALWRLWKDGKIKDESSST